MLLYKDIGRRIKRFRNEKRITQRTLSEGLGQSESYISQVERGVNTVSLKNLYKIADLLDTDIGLLVSDTVVLPNTKINREVNELIADWTDEEKENLIAHLELINKRRKTQREE